MNSCKNLKIYVINGPNLNMLGIREPEHYGSGTYSSLCQLIQKHTENYVSENNNKYNVETVFYQSNHEGDLVDKIQEAYFQNADGIIINPGAYTHTSVAILDAVKSTKLPTVEVHISKVEERESFRQISFIREACIYTITGEGFNGYLSAFDKLIEYLEEKK